MNFLRKITPIFLAFFLFTLPATTDAANADHIVYIECGYIISGSYYAISAGSGVVISDGVVITNAHVIVDDDNYYYDYCAGGVAPNSYTSPELEFFLEPSELARYDDYFDYAFMLSYDWSWNDYYFDDFALVGNADSLVSGDFIEAIGYPAIGGATITSTTGTVSGFEGSNWIKSDVAIDHGNSGGAAFDSEDYLIGITTQAVAGSISSIAYIQNINAILEDALGASMFVRDYSNLFEPDNYVCWDDFCYNIGIDEDEASSNFSETESTASDDEEKTESNPASQSTEYDEELTEQLVGYILLQVESNGEAWYVHPEKNKRYYMKDGDVAYEMMRSFGLGITDANLDDIPYVDTANEMLESESICNTNSIANQVRGQILLQVEQHGEAWYVHPDTCKRIYMKDGDTAYDIMRFLSLGISNSNLAKIEAGILNE